MKFKIVKSQHDVILSITTEDEKYNEALKAFVIYHNLNYEIMIDLLNIFGIQYEIEEVCACCECLEIIDKELFECPFCGCDFTV